MAAVAANQQSQIKQINRKISNLNQAIAKDKKNREALYVELESIERRLDSLSQKNHVLKTKTNQLSLRQEELLDSINTLKTKRTTQQQHLAQHLIASYQLGNEQYLKLLLNQQNPYMVSRLLDYYKYINQARVDTINKLYSTQKALDTKNSELDKTLRRLQSLNQQYELQKKEQLVEQQQRQAILAQLNQSIASKANRLEKLKADKERLSKVIRRVSKAPHRNPKKFNFASMRRRMDWPTQGKVMNKFAARIAGSRLRYNGITIQAPEGQDVFPIYPGKVVFADWLRGFGLLLILDHGRGYMSLYAHNQSLYKKLGDWVSSQQPIAAVGHSGGFTKNGLYFEIRQNGKPINPMQWLKPQS